MSEERRKIILEDTRFIFRTNFAGLPDEKYHSTTRYGNILIPDPEVAMELADEGYDVKQTRPHEGEEEGFEPRYYVKILLNYTSDIAKRRPPRVYLVEQDGYRRLLNEDTVGEVDAIYVLSVNVTLEKSYSKRYEKPLLYIRTMYVYHDEDDDPWDSNFRSAGQPEED